MNHFAKPGRSRLVAAGALGAMLELVAPPVLAQASTPAPAPTGSSTSSGSSAPTPSAGSGPGGFRGAGPEPLLPRRQPGVHLRLERVPRSRRKGRRVLEHQSARRLRPADRPAARIRQGDRLRQSVPGRKGTGQRQLRNQRRRGSGDHREHFRRGLCQFRPEPRLLRCIQWTSQRAEEHRADRDHRCASSLGRAFAAHARRCVRVLEARLFGAPVRLLGDEAENGQRDPVLPARRSSAARTGVSTERNRPAQGLP